MYKRDEISSLTQSQKRKKKKKNFSFKINDTKILLPPIQLIRKFRSETRTSTPPSPKRRRKIDLNLESYRVPIESKGRRIVEPINRETVAFVPL